ncbi:hypothetical protein OXT66_05485 [Lentilactobacillus senioris]|uniref:hypothetical protein n=1 Tax=Lentilactobacillus senioris TaxID=931534 RepID=UPI002282DB0A|nr:hypothetical protein [Lentilactobacillus senioris]MCY9807002.1 hypothetical protein [Lentilactobacillus senioris]
MITNDSFIQQNIGWFLGVDIKAHINNYVVVVPSINHENRYEWLKYESIVKDAPELLHVINKQAPNNYYLTEFKASGDCFVK